MSDPRSAALTDTVTAWFPGEGTHRPSTREWLLADLIVGTPLPRVHQPGTRLVWAQPGWRNRAFLRSQVRRHLISVGSGNPADPLNPALRARIRLHLLTRQPPQP